MYWWIEKRVKWAVEATLLFYIKQNYFRTAGFTGAPWKSHMVFADYKIPLYFKLYLAMSGNMY